MHQLLYKAYITFFIAFLTLDWEVSCDDGNLVAECLNGMVSFFKITKNNEIEQDNNDNFENLTIHNCVSNAIKSVKLDEDYDTQEYIYDYYLSMGKKLDSRRIQIPTEFCRENNMQISQSIRVPFNELDCLDKLAKFESPPDETGFFETLINIIFDSPSTRILKNALYNFTVHDFKKEDYETIYMRHIIVEYGRGTLELPVLYCDKLLTLQNKSKDQ